MSADVRRVAVSSIGRGADVDHASGYLRVVDLERGAVTFKTPVPESRWRPEDPNPRGGTRGARGVAVHGDRFVLGTHEDVTVLDTGWSLVRRFTHPILSSVHDVLADERGILGQLYARRFRRPVRLGRRARRLVVARHGSEDREVAQPASRPAVRP